MTRLPYNKKPWRVELLFWLIAVASLLLFFGGAWLDSLFDVKWICIAAGFSILVILTLARRWIDRKVAMAMVCPQCSRAPLKDAEDERRCQLLICETCGIEWATGLSKESES